MNDVVYEAQAGYDMLWSPAAYAMQGLGQTVPVVPGSGGSMQPTEQSDMLMRVAYLALMGIGGFVAGKAMAPDDEKENLYGIAGVFLGLMAGPLGLGVLGGLALTTGRSSRRAPVWGGAR